MMLRPSARIACIVAVVVIVGCTNQPEDRDPQPGGSGGTAGGESASGMRNLIDATVQVDTYVENDDGQLVRAGSGSGTILTSEGLILTNAHVAAPDAPGQAVQYGEPGPDDPVERLVVRMTEAEDQAPVERYRASLVVADGYLDVAVIQIDATADGGPVESLDLPFVAVGDSDVLRIGDPLTVVGFPGIGGDTVSADTGDVSGFLADDHIGERGWIKTSAVVHYGNSGGLAANADGEIVGVPTRAPEGTDATDVGGFQLLRPINLAAPVIDAAMSGTGYGDSPWVVGETGQETVTFRGWADPASDSCRAEDMLSGYSSGAKAVQAIFDWSGFAPGEDVMFWLIKGPRDPSPRIIRELRSRWEGDASGSCFAVTWADDRGFEDATYAAAAYVGPNLRLEGQATMTIPSQPATDTEGVTLSGSIIDAGSGGPIGDALVFALVPGTDAAGWRQNPTAEAIAANAETAAADGSYRFDRPLQIGMAYPLLIYAQGYVTWVGTLTVRSADPIGAVGLVRSTP